MTRPISIATALYGGPAGDYPDNAERYSEFCRVAIEIAKNVWPADLIHCHDWQAALVPVLLRTAYAADPVAKNFPVVFTIHNIGYQGLFRRDVLSRADIPASTFHPGRIEFFGDVNLLKGGLVYSDYLTTVSRKYAQEIQTLEFGNGLDGVVRTRADRLVGILNGVDYTAWNPETDKLIAARYSVNDLSGKQDMQTSAARTIRAAARRRNAPADRHRLALCGPKGIRSDRRTRSRADAGKYEPRGAGNR